MSYEGYWPDEWQKMEFGGLGNPATREVLNPPRLTLVSESGSEPVSLTDLKQWIRVDQDYENSLITSLGKSCRRQVEKYCRRSLMVHTFDLWFDHVPPTRKFEFPWLPVTEVTSITTYDLDNNPNTQDPSTYVVDTNDLRPQVFLNIGDIWNVPTRRYQGFKCRFVADGTAFLALQGDVFIEAIKMLADAKYQNRGQLADPLQVEMPRAIKEMLNPFRKESL
jgi:uncharacterized phiE125 gp8 family phage protein